MSAAADRSKIRRAILLSLHYARDDGPVVFNGSAVGTWTHADFNQAMAGLQELLAENQQLREVERAARTLWDFLENEKETHEPPRELLDQGWIACESSADYDKEERLSEALGAALAAVVEE